MNRKFIHSMISMIAVVLLAGCGSSGLGDILGGGGGSTATQQNVVSGTVDRVDTRNQTIVLRDARTSRTSLQNTGGGGDVVYLDYDSNTVVEYSGQTYSPTALEPGDRVEANAEVVGNRMVADRIRVTYNVSGTGSSTSPGAITDLRGTITAIDTRTRMITVQQDSWNRTGQTYRFAYESNTPVYWQGRVFPPENLERGDVVDVDLRQSGNTLIAHQIDVIESSSQQSSAGLFEPDLRGTVQSVDTRASTITVQQPTWIQRFNSGTNTGNTVTIRYDSSTTVEYNGQLYSPANLERGDMIEVDVNDFGNSLMAEQIVVVSDARQSRF